MLARLAPTRGAHILAMGATQLLLVLFLESACVTSGSAPCIEAGRSSLECEAAPDTRSIGSSLLQSHKVSSTLGGDVAAAGIPLSADLDSAGAAGRDGTEAPTRFSLLQLFGTEGHETRPSLSLLQAFSAGSGTRSFVEAQPRRHKLHDSVRQSNMLQTEQSSFFFLVPMGVSLVACCMILSLVYCFMSGERAEDERLAKFLGHIEPGAVGKRNGPSIDPKIHAQSHARASAKPQKVTETPDHASTSSSSSVSTAATTTAAVREDTGEESATETTSADEAAGVATADGSELKGGCLSD